MQRLKITKRGWVIFCHYCNEVVSWIEEETEILPGILCPKCKSILEKGVITEYLYCPKDSASHNRFICRDNQIYCQAPGCGHEMVKDKYFTENWPTDDNAA